MKPVASKKIEVLCSAIAVIAVVSVAAAITALDRPDRSAADISQEVNRAAKANLLAFPDVALTVARSDKADSRLMSVASTLPSKPEPAHLEASAETTGAAGKSAGTPVSAGGTAATLTVATDDAPARTTDGTTALSEDDGKGALVEPVANTNEPSNNFAEEPEESNAPSGSAWNYSREFIESAGQRARSLWDFLIGRD